MTRSKTIFPVLEKIDKMMGKEDYLSLIIGKREISIIMSARYKEALLNLLGNEEILKIEENLGVLSLIFPMDFLYIPGLIFAVVGAISNISGINIFEVVSTLTELSFVLSEKDVDRAKEALQAMVSSHKK